MSFNQFYQVFKGLFSVEDTDLFFYYTYFLICSVYSLSSTFINFCIFFSSFNNYLLVNILVEEKVILSNYIFWSI